MTELTHWVLARRAVRSPAGIIPWSLATISDSSTFAMPVGNASLAEPADKEIGVIRVVPLNCTGDNGNHRVLGQVSHHCDIAGAGSRFPDGLSGRPHRETGVRRFDCPTRSWNFSPV